MKKRKNPLIKPFLKWAGGKRQLMDDIRPFIPKKFTTYYEPFVGAGAVLFDNQPKKAVINDFNEQLITTYRVVKNNVEELIVLLKDYKQKHSEEFYYSMRELDRDIEEFNKLSAVEIAARFIFLNKSMYAGLHRVNKAGQLNTPWGRYKNPMICDEPVLRAVSLYLNKNDIEMYSGDFSLVLNTADKNSFVYFDPPYHSDNDTNFTGYQAGGFDADEQIRLRNVFDELSRRGVKCLLSNADTPFIRELYAAYTIVTVQAKRIINSDVNGRGEVNEVLVRNY